MAEKTEKDDILDLINLELNWGFLDRNIGDERYTIERNANAPVEYTREYDEFNFFEYLVFYKINRLFELGKISLQQRDLLGELYCESFVIMEESTKLLREDWDNQTNSHEKEVSLLNNKVEEIHAILAKFNLMPSDDLFPEINIKDIIDKIISAEKYDNIPSNDELSDALKRIKIK